MNDELLTRYLTGEANADEIQQVDQWLKNNGDSDNYNEGCTIIDAVEKLTPATQTKEEAWSDLLGKIDLGKEAEDYIELPFDRAENRKTSSFLRIAAIFIALLGISAVIYYLAGNNGKQLEWISANTTADKTELTLPDGSTVDLNENTKFDYPKAFAMTERRVSLNGEAYFNITRDEQKPFIITAGDAEIRVLGTTFTVSTRNGKVTVVVESGKVSLSKAGDEIAANILLPGDKGCFDPAKGTVIVSKNNDPNFLAWKTGILVFEETSLVDVISVLSQLYDKKIVMGNDNISSCKLTATYEHLTCEEIIEIMSLTMGLDVTRKGNDIILKGEGCTQ